MVNGRQLNFTLEIHFLSSCIKPRTFLHKILFQHTDTVCSLRQESTKVKVDKKKCCFPCLLVDENMASNSGDTTDINENKRKQAEIRELLDKEEIILRKRLPRKLPKRDCDVYVTRNTDFKQQLKRCQKILDHGNLVCIHGLGQAINRAVNLALQLQAGGMGSVELATHTDTVELLDDIEPLTDERGAEVLSRNSSAVHIRVYRPGIQETINAITDIEKQACSKT